MQKEYRYFIYTCNSTARDYTQGALYGYKVVLQLATVLMAIKSRKVKIQGVNDCREIILATYISSFVLMIIFIFNIFVADRLNLYTVFTSFGLFVGTTAIMVLVFVPKVKTNSCCCFVVVIYSLIVEVIKALLGYHDCIAHVCMYLCLFGLDSIGNGWVGPWDKAINMFSLVPRPHPHERMGSGDETSTRIMD